MSYGYHGKLLEIDLTNKTSHATNVDPEIFRDVIGGAGWGAKLLLDRRSESGNWDDPDNPLMFLCGPFSGLSVPGSGNVCVVTQGALTNFAGCSQANGYFGAYLRLNGYDGAVLTGKSDNWCYLYLKDGEIQFCDASEILGLDTYQTHDRLQQIHENEPLSIGCVGPAAENLVKFSCICFDQGHIAAHSGMGTVMGDKKVKAFVIVKGNKPVEVADPEKLKENTKLLFDYAIHFNDGLRHKFGTGGNFTHIHDLSQLPVRNLTTNVWNYVQNIDGKTLHKSGRFTYRPKSCWACAMHGRWMKITSGPYEGYEGKETEYEIMAACTSNIDNKKSDLMFVLSTEIDKLGLNGNECNWIMAWCMECYEHGWLTNEMLNGIDLTWGNAEGAIELLRLIVSRKAAGDFLAEGIKKAAEHLGGEAYNAAVFTLKGNIPRGHDHRARWDEYLDTNLSCCGTIECTGGFLKYEKLGLVSPADRFDPLEVGRAIGQISGWRQFEDSLGMCRFIIEESDYMLNCFEAITGVRLTPAEVFKIGKRYSMRMRVFDFLHGMTPDMEFPSPRYGSPPNDGLLAGKDILGNYRIMRRRFLQEIGCNTKTAIPNSDTLLYYGLDEWVPAMEKLQKHFEQAEPEKYSENATMEVG